MNVLMGRTGLSEWTFRTKGVRAGIMLERFSIETI